MFKLAMLFLGGNARRAFLARRVFCAALNENIKKHYPAAVLESDDKPHARTERKDVTQ